MRDGDQRYSSRRTKSTDERLPKAFVLSAAHQGKGYLVRVACPLCGDSHTHGVSEEEFRRGGDLGHASAHCVAIEAADVRSGGYYIWAFGPSGMQPPLIK